MSSLRLWQRLLLYSALVLTFVNNVVHGKGFFQCTEFDTETTTLTNHKEIKTTTVISQVGTSPGAETLLHARDTAIVTSTGTTTPGTTTPVTTLVTTDTTTTSVTTTVSTTFSTKLPVTTTFATSPVKTTTSVTTVFPSTTPVSTLFTTESSFTTPVTTLSTPAFPSTTPITTSLTTITTIQESDSNAQVSDETTDVDTSGSSSCPANMVLMLCTCQATCADPTHSNGCHVDCPDPMMTVCICPDGFYLQGNHCVPPQQCGCYLPQVGVIPTGEFHVKSGCSEICFCLDDVLSCENYECSPNAICYDISNTNGQCKCKAGFYGSGVNCTRFHDCEELFAAGYTTEGVYTLRPFGWMGMPFEVYCKGGWMILQRRVNGEVEFNRTWNSYKEGFGDPRDEHWLGNDKLSFFTNQVPHQLRIDLQTVSITTNQGNTTSIEWHYLTYDGFQISDESSNFALIYDIASFGGSMDYDYLAYHYDMKFTTFDRDNDFHFQQNCAKKHSGGWWFYSCYALNLNGEYGRQDDTGICLLDRSKPNPATSCNTTFTEMAMRPMIDSSFS